MKKVKISNISLGDIKQNGTILALSGEVAVRARRRDISTMLYLKGVSIPAGGEYEINDTASTSLINYSIINVLNINDSSFAIINIGLYVSVGNRRVIHSVGSSSFGMSPSGTEKILVYRKTTSGNIFVKNNSGGSIQFDFKVF